MWEQTIDSIKDRVATDLEVPVSRKSKAVLYKMLLYGPGPMVKQRREYVIMNASVSTGTKKRFYSSSEKMPLMFRTLVICLPSQH